MYFDGIAADTSGVIEILKMLRCGEIVAASQYREHAMKLTGFSAPALEDELLEHAKEEDGHAHVLWTLIRNLGGVIETRVGDIPAFSFNGEDAATAVDNVGMLALDLAAEQKAIVAYSEAIKMVKHEWFDVAVALARILSDEREHASDLASFLAP